MTMTMPSPMMTMPSPVMVPSPMMMMPSEATNLVVPGWNQPAGGYLVDETGDPLAEQAYSPWPQESEWQVMMSGVDQ